VTGLNAGEVVCSEALYRTSAGELVLQECHVTEGRSMSTRGYRLQVHDKVRTLEAVVDAFCGCAHISIEGDLSQFKWSGPPFTNEKDCPILRRNTTWPPQDFVILPLEEETRDRIRAILHGVGLKRRVWHVLIEKGGEMVFCAYDAFDEGCWVSEAVGTELLDSLIRQGVLKGYTPVV
jgi:hypothetical protein